MGASGNKELIIKQLISLKVVLFIFFGGLGCLFPFLPSHMLAVGLDRDESRIISMVSPLVSILGAIIFCPLVDHFATKKGATGKHLRIIASITMIIGPIIYLTLLLIDHKVEKFETKLPAVSFACDLDGALLYQRRIEEQKSCYYWETGKTGAFILTNCSYTCQNPAQFENMYTPWNSNTVYTDASPEDEYDSAVGDLNDDISDDNTKQNKNATAIEPPHLCKEGINKDDPIVCHVYTDATNNLILNATLRGAINQENDTHSAEWCKYPLDGFKCNIPQEQIKIMNEKKKKNVSVCDPMIECDIIDPYRSESILKDTLKIHETSCTFWWYLIIRSIADCFPIATIAILNAGIIIATRETSTGRGDVGHQYVWASIGFAIFAPIIGAIEPHLNNYLIPMVVFLMMSFIAALVLLSSSEMPLSPPEWWWHTKSGMVAIPLSSIRKYGAETVGVSIVSILLGSLWSMIDSYQGWFLKDLTDNIYETNVIVTLTLTIGALSAIPCLWFAERIIDFCGHSNILITSFAVYVIRFILMAVIRSAWLILIMEAMEPLTLGLTWITIILYIRHLIPRRLTATGQAIPVIAHFCIGKSLGAAFGFFQTNSNSLESFRTLYRFMGVYALIIAVFYFVLYHCVLAPLCGTGPLPQPTEIIEGMRPNGNGGNGNPNGNYTPLRVYHNGRGRKGQFRY